MIRATPWIAAAVLGLSANAAGQPLTPRAVDCRATRACSDYGSCSITYTAYEMNCVATSQDDCRASTGCTEDGFCLLDAAGHRCVRGGQRPVAPGYQAAGVVGLSVAVVTMAAGLAALAAIESCAGTMCEVDSSSQKSARLAYPVIFGVGALGFGLGIWGLMAAEGGQVSRVKAQRPDALGAPTILVRPASGALRWSL